MDNLIFDLQRHSQGAVTPILTRGCPRSNRADPPVAAATQRASPAGPAAMEPAKRYGRTLAGAAEGQAGLTGAE